MAKGDPKKEPQILNRLKTLLGWAVFISLVSCLWLLMIPKEAENAVLLGYSLRRLALMLPLLLPALLAMVCLVLLDRKTKWQSFFNKSENQAKTARFLMAGGLLVSVATWSSTFLFHFLRFSPDIGLFVRLLPFLFCYFVLGLTGFKAAAILLGGATRGVSSNKLLFDRRAFWVAGIILTVIFALIEFTGLGKDPQRVSISSLGVPLLEGQILYVVGLLVLIQLFSRMWMRLPEDLRPKSRIRPDTAIMLVLWLLAVIFWMSQPLPKHNYFAPQVQPPNFEKYPFSDADQYDRNGLMVMLGAIKGSVVSKPLYVSFLAILHAIGGYSYDRIVLLQTLVLALLPVVLYQIGRELHSRLAGIGIAMLAILREVNAIQASSIANVSNSKLMLSDLPATLLVSVLILVILRWLRQPKDQPAIQPLIAGGIVGMLILMRIQTIMLVPFLLLVSFIYYFKQWKRILLAMGLIFIAIALVLSPILIRNHAITGVYWVDDPASSSALYRFFIDAAEYDLDIPQAETREEMLNRNLTVISQVLGQNLGGVLYSVSDHFLRNVISTTLVLPVRLGNTPAALDLVRIEDPFWAEVYTTSNPVNIAVLLVNILVIALGVAAVFRRHANGIIALAGFYVVYNLSSALVRLSGWRFILPVDWLAYGCFAVGLVVIIQKLVSGLVPQPENLQENWLLEPSEPVKVFRVPSALLFGLFFLFTGAIIPLREVLIPPIVPEYTQGEVCERIRAAVLDSEWSPRAEEIYNFCMQDDTRALTGFGFYPRFFKAGEGYYDRTYDPYFGNQDYARLTFRLIGTSNAGGYIKTEDPQIRFPNGSRVWIGGKAARKFEVQVVLIEGNQPQLIISDALIN